MERPNWKSARVLSKYFWSAEKQMRERIIKYRLAKREKS